MWQYEFYTQAFKAELIEKVEGLAKENGVYSHYQIQSLNEPHTTYKLIYEIEEDKEQWDEGLAQVLCDIMQKSMMNSICQQFLKKREDLSKEEQSIISQAFINNNYLSRQEGFSYISYYLVYVPIYKEIQRKSSLNLEGWLRFRLSKYRQLLTEVLVQFVEDYVAKKDAINFIRMMREVSELAEPLEERLHIVYRKEGKVQLLDATGRNMTGYYIKKYCKDLLLDTSLTREDLLLHVLITLNPKTLIVHNRQYATSEQLLHTLNIIFDEKITYCTGCTLCTLDKASNKIEE